MVGFFYSSFCFLDFIFHFHPFWFVFYIKYNAHFLYFFGFFSFLSILFVNNLFDFISLHLVLIMLIAFFYIVFLKKILFQFYHLTFRFIWFFNPIFTLILLITLFSSCLFFFLKGVFLVSWLELVVLETIIMICFLIPSLILSTTIKLLHDIILIILFNQKAK